MQRKIFFLSFLQVLLILAVGCKTPYEVVRSTANSLQVDSTADRSIPSVTERFLEPYRQKLKDSFSTVIAQTTDKLVKKRPGGSLGNLVIAGVKMNEDLSYPFDVVPRYILMNYGGIRLQEIAKGDITIGKIFELLPFENTIVRVEISGVQLADLLENINKQQGWPSYWTSRHFNSLSELRKIKQVMLITNNYIAQGGDNCDIFKTLPQEDTGILLRNSVIKYLKNQKTITPDETDYILK